MEGVPLKAPDFSVFLNGRRLMPRSLTGQSIPIMEGCKYGLVSGEIVITPLSSASHKDLGIDVKVKSVTIKKDLFGMETWGKVISRIKGEINADFLPITSDRSNFVIDSDEYREFLKIIKKIIEIIKKALGREADRREDLRAGRVVKEALQRIHKALAKNPDLSPFGPIPYGEEGGPGGGAAVAKAKGKEISEAEIKPEMKETRTPRLAYNRQSKLLKDAFTED